jgi:hypothetical protein
MKNLSEEELQKNWEKLLALLDKLEEDRRDAAKAMIEHLGVRLMTCPASGRIDYHNCFVGGLVDHSLRVVQNALILRKAFEWTSKIKVPSLIVGCLFHDLGKVGDLEKDYYVPQTSDWHRDKLGELFVTNKELDYMTVPDRSLFLCQHFRFPLNRDEMLAIKLHDGQYTEDNRSYRMKEPLLSDVVHMADLISTKQEKEKETGKWSS